MPDWATFVGLTGVVITLFLALARLSQTAVRDDSPPTGSADAEVDIDADDTATDYPGALSAAEVEARYGDATTSSVRDDDRSPDAVAGRSPASDHDRESTPGRNGDDPVAPTGDPTEETWAVEIESDTPDEGSHHPFQHDAGESGRGTELRSRTLDGISTGALLANVALTQGVFGVLVVAAAFYTSVPASAFGITSDPLSTGLPGVAVGVALGIALYVANELGAAGADALGIEYDEQLRGMLSPESAGGWILLFGGVLPVIAAVEEFLFRAAIVGAVHAGFGTSPWALAVVSALAFALGHGAQGRVGVVVTGALGFVLAAAFVLTGSLLVVFVAHYLVNALEFAVHELLGIEWAERGTD